jgi:hypothetical protein
MPAGGAWRRETRSHFTENKGQCSQGRRGGDELELLGKRESIQERGWPVAGKHILSLHPGFTEDTTNQP